MNLGELRALVRLTLASAAAWPDATLDGWIGQGIRLYGAHFGEVAVPAAGDDTAAVGVPESHIEAITAYVAFAAQYELQADEAVVVDASTVVLSQLGQEARRAWERYKDVMDRLVWLGGGTIVDVPQPNWGDIGL